MFRPTHFVILFAVVFCAAAFPGPPANPAPSDPVRALETGGLSPKKPSQNPEGVAKGDLDTDAQTYLAYTYYGPRLGYYNPGFVRSHAWGFGTAYGLPYHIY